MRIEFGTEVSLGFLGILGVHELGHSAAARYFRVQALWPMFLPWIGAVVVILHKSHDEREKAWIGIAGPVAGVTASVILHCLALHTDSEVFLNAALWGYTLHMVNLIPAGNLDGGQIAGFLGRWLWVPGAAILAGFGIFCAELPWYGWLIFSLVLITAASRAGGVVLVWLGNKTRPKARYADKRSACILWAVWLLLLGLCVVATRLGHAQLAEIQSNSIEVPWESILRLTPGGH